MSKLDDLIEVYLTEAKKIGFEVDTELLIKITKGLGPAVYNADSSKVSSSDQAELDRVKANFLIKKLGLSDGPQLDEAIAKAVEGLGKSNPNKYRALFYYILVKELGKEAVYA